MIKGISRIAMAGALCAAGFCGQAVAAQDVPSSAPNIILIIADDVGLDMTPGMYPGLISDLSRQYGPEGRDHPDVARIAGHPASTPVLDKLASQGMVFANAWAQPFCSPTRASMLTGLFAANTHVATYADALSQQHDSFVRRLHEAGGYSTGVFGKWHMAGLPGRDGAPDYPGMKPLEAGFESFRGNMHAALPTFWEYDVHVQDASTAPGEWLTLEPAERSLPGIAPTTYAGVTKTADTIDWIRRQEAENPDRPWFAWMAFNLAHATINQQPSAMIVPNADTLDEPSRAEMEACGGHFGTNDPGGCSGEAMMRAMTNSMDTMIGQVLATIDELDPNTYVIFVADNGTPMYGRPGLDFIDNMYITREGRGKGTAFQSGAHVALTIRGPGITPGTRSDEVVHVVDLFPTILQLASLAVPEQVSNSAGDATIPLDGVSLMPILSREAETIRDPREDYILTESENLLADGIKLVGARNAHYKVVCTGSAEDCVLYDLEADPLEEYPLEAPASCEGGEAADPESAAWSYCYLTQAVAERSIIAWAP